MKFHYWDKGTLATIGRNKAVGDLNFMHVSGFVAWLLWAGIHIFYLVGYRNRFAVMGEWFWNYITFYRGSRLITGTQAGQEALHHPAAGADPMTPAGAVATAAGSSKP